MLGGGSLSIMAGAGATPSVTAGSPAYRRGWGRAYAWRSMPKRSASHRGWVCAVLLGLAAVAGWMGGVISDGSQPAMTYSSSLAPSMLKSLAIDDARLVAADERFRAEYSSIRPGQ